MRVEVPVGLEQSCYLDALVEPQAAGHTVDHLQLGGDSQRVPDCLAHRCYDLPRKARAPLEITAPLVGAPVQLGAEEGAEKVVVSEVQLDRIDPGVGGAARGRGEVGGDAGDVVVGPWRGSSAWPAG